MRYLIFLVAAGLTAQTTIPPSMLRESSALSSPPSEIRFYAVDLLGAAFRVKVGAGLGLRQTPAGWVLDAAPVTPPPPPRLTARVLQANAWGHYVVSAEALIIRNGMFMSAGIDYDHNGEGALPKMSWAGDLIVAIEMKELPALALQRVPRNTGGEFCVWGGADLQGGIAATLIDSPSIQSLAAAAKESLND